MLKRILGLVLVATVFACGDSGPIKKNTNPDPTTPTGCMPTCEEGFACVDSTCVEESDPNTCESDEEYNPQLRVCLVPSCDNGIKDSAEEGPDCGGPCAPCSEEATCTDGIQNGGETGVDCGGSCAACVIPTSCGDGSIQAPEQCDHGGTVQLSCPYGDMSCQVCNAQCQLVDGQVTGYCGDGTVQQNGGEDCDLGGASETACAYGQMSCQVCNTQCRLVAGTTSFCGDGVRQSNEECDGTQLNSASCSSLGEGTGTLGCSATCTYDIAACVSTPTSPDVFELALGFSHTCARLSDSTVRCWGRNDDGRLGNGAFSPRSAIPVTVLGLTDASQVVAGGYHSCARRQNGTVVCWGSNLTGQLGNGGLNDSAVPVPVTGLSNITTLSAGTRHTCAVDTARNVYCWGSASSGQLGNGSSTGFYGTPQLVAFDGIQVSSGFNHTCLRHFNNTASCWGGNDASQLGNYNQFSDSPFPVSVLDSFGFDLTNIGYIGSGDRFTCARQVNSVLCWGSNTYSQLGNSSVFGSTPYPTLVSGTYDRLTVGERHVCAERTDGAVACWGNNQNGRLGIGTTIDQPSPTLLTLPPIVDVTAGGTHTCARMSAGGVMCWGRNSDGQLGDGSLADRLSPVNVVF